MVEKRVVVGNQRSSRMDDKPGGPVDPIDMFLDHLSEVGSAAAMPEVSLPGVELGYVYSQGRSKCNRAVCCGSQ